VTNNQVLNSKCQPTFLVDISIEKEKGLAIRFSLQEKQQQKTLADICFLVTSLSNETNLGHFSHAFP
jgi:hypothetical protein